MAIGSKAAFMLKSAGGASGLVKGAGVLAAAGAQLTARFMSQKALKRHWTPAHLRQHAQSRHGPSPVLAACATGMVWEPSTEVRVCGYLQQLPSPNPRFLYSQVASHGRRASASWSLACSLYQCPPESPESLRSCLCSGAGGAAAAATATTQPPARQPAAYSRPENAPR